jgi:hypothetical protein
MRRSMAGMMVLALAACGAGVPRPEEITVAAPAGMTLPVQGRAMVMMAESDLSRTFSYSLNRVSAEQTKIPEGQAMDLAARTVLGRAFATVATNSPALRPHVLARTTGKAVWNRADGSYRVSCEVSAFESDGMPIGRYSNAFNATPITGFETALPALYSQCFKGPVEELMRSSTISRLNAAGFPEPDAVKTAGYLRSQGYVVK